LAVNIAERVKFLASIPERTIPFDFDEMSEKVQVMLHHSLDALVNMSPSMAVQVCDADDEVDALNRDMYKRVEREMKARPEDAPSLIPFLGVAWRLERIGDHATNIAEDVIYMIEGEIIRHRYKDSGHHDKKGHGDLF
jgi:phosphate transport system protein